MLLTTIVVSLYVTWRPCSCFTPARSPIFINPTTHYLAVSAGSASNNVEHYTQRHWTKIWDRNVTIKQHDSVSTDNNIMTLELKSNQTQRNKTERQLNHFGTELLPYAQIENWKLRNGRFLVCSPRIKAYLANTMTLV